MAIIYGRAETEKDLLNLAPDTVKKVEDIETIHQELKNKLSAYESQCLKDNEENS